MRKKRVLYRLNQMFEYSALYIFTNHIQLSGENIVDISGYLRNFRNSKIRGNKQKVKVKKYG